MDVQAAVAFEAGKPLSIETVKLDGPREGEVLVEVKATGSMSKVTSDKLALAVQAASWISCDWHCQSVSSCIDLSMHVTWLLTESWELTCRAGRRPSFPPAESAKA